MPYLCGFVVCFLFLGQVCVLLLVRSVVWVFGFDVWLFLGWGWFRVWIWAGCLLVAMRV